MFELIFTKNALKYLTCFRKSEQVLIIDASWRMRSEAKTPSNQKLNRTAKTTMTQTAKKPIDIYQELLDLPENMLGEIINGELHTQPRPAPKHALAASYLGSDLVGPYGKGSGGPGGWWIIDEPEIHLGSNIFVPDIAGWKKERMPLLPKTAYFDLAPDWICEVLSQSTARKDRVLKMPLYAKNKVQYIWLIEPTTKILEVYQLEGQYWTLLGTFADSDKVTIVPFMEISIDLSFLWEKTD